MARRISLTAGPSNLWEQLDALRQIDPSLSGGIESIVHGHSPITPRSPSGALLASGYEDIYEIEPGFCLYVADGVIDQDWRLTARTVDHTLRLRIVFIGEAGFTSQNSRMSERATRCSFIIRPPGEWLTSSFQGGMRYRYCSLSLTRLYLCQGLSVAEQELPAALRQDWSRRETVMGDFPASKEVLVRARQSFNIGGSDAWRAVAAKAVALDLLRLIIQDWQMKPRLRTSVRIRPQEQTKVMQLRAQIESDPAAPLTLARASSRTGMHRNKLHIVFMQNFGISIHDYQTELRMRLAKSLLETTDLPVGEIAGRTGYSEPANFTAAFKKYFEMLPREVRRARSRPEASP